MTFKTYLITCTIGGIILSCVLISSIFLTGNTFGQKCEKYGYKKDSPGYEDCVRHLSEGVNNYGK